MCVFVDVMLVCSIGCCSRVLKRNTAPALLAMIEGLCV